MTDLLIPDVPDDVLAAIEAKARRVGLTRIDYLLRILERERASTGQPVRVQDLSRFAEDFRDLGSRGAMRRAWE
jgi:hypothetical protein